MAKTIMFVHGAWVTKACWENFTAFFEARGYTCLAPAWPYLDKPVRELQAGPDPRLAEVKIVDLVNHFEAEIRQLPEPPILIGHSFGGLIVQLLLDRGLGSKGVSIDPGPPRGVLPTPTALASALPILLSWQGWKRVLRMSFGSFAKTFANALPADQLRSVYEARIVPTPGRIYFQAALGIGNAVNFKNPRRAPLLLTAGDQDRTAPAAMVHANYLKHRQSPAPVDFIVFPGHSHWLIAEPGWEDVAAKIAEWLTA